MRRRLRQEQWEVRNLMGRSEAVRMAQCLGEELGSELNKGMWLGSESRMDRDKRGRDRRERRGEWESLAVEDRESRFWVVGRKDSWLRDLLRMERKEMGGGNAMVKIGGTRWSIKGWSVRGCGAESRGR